MEDTWTNCVLKRNALASLQARQDIPVAMEGCYGWLLWAVAMGNRSQIDLHFMGNLLIPHSTPTRPVLQRLPCRMVKNPLLWAVAMGGCCGRRYADLSSFNREYFDTPLDPFWNVCFAV